MKTRIFTISYNVTEKYNGKDGSSFKETKTIVAKDAIDAVSKISKQALQAGSYIDEESKKKVIVTRVAFDPIEVVLIAETDA